MMSAQIETRPKEKILTATTIRDSIFGLGFLVMLVLFLLGSFLVGIILFIVHIVAAALVALAIRFVPEKIREETPSFQVAVSLVFLGLFAALLMYVLTGTFVLTYEYNMSPVLEDIIYYVPMFCIVLIYISMLYLILLINNLLWFTRFTMKKSFVESLQMTITSGLLLYWHLGIALMADYYYDMGIGYINVVSFFSILYIVILIIFLIFGILKTIIGAYDVLKIRLPPNIESAAEKFELKPEWFTSLNTLYPLVLLILIRSFIEIIVWFLSIAIVYFISIMLFAAVQVRPPPEVPPEIVERVAPLVPERPLERPLIGAPPAEIRDWVYFALREIVRDEPLVVTHSYDVSKKKMVDRVYRETIYINSMYTPSDVFAGTRILIKEKIPLSKFVAVMFGLFVGLVLAIFYYFIYTVLEEINTIAITLYIVLLTIGLAILYDKLKPLFMRRELGAKEYIFVCSQCKKIVPYNKAIIISDNNHPVYSRFLGRTYKIDALRVVIAFIIGLCVILLSGLINSETGIFVLCALMLLVGLLAGWLLYPVRRRMPKEILEVTYRGKFGGIVKERFELIGCAYTVYCISCLKKHKVEVYNKLAKIATERTESEVEEKLEDSRKRFFARAGRGIFWSKHKDNLA